LKFRDSLEGVGTDQGPAEAIKPIERSARWSSLYDFQWQLLDDVPIRAHSAATKEAVAHHALSEQKNKQGQDGYKRKLYESCQAQSSFFRVHRIPMRFHRDRSLYARRFCRWVGRHGIKQSRPTSIRIDGNDRPTSNLARGTVAIFRSPLQV
jgi:hypothetical protein